MASLACSCFKRVGENLKCCKCGIYMIKYGKDSKGKQRYYCRNCNKTQVQYYTYQAYKPEVNTNIIALTKEGVGVLSTARLLSISPTTLLKRILKLASEIIPPPISIGNTYEVDEMRTYVKNKCCVFGSSIAV